MGFSARDGASNGVKDGLKSLSEWMHHIDFAAWSGEADANDRINAFFSPALRIIDMAREVDCPVQETR